MQVLNEKDLSATIVLDDLGFQTTKDLIRPKNGKSMAYGWVAQTEAKRAAQFGLEIPQSGFNILVLGQPGTGRASLMQAAMLATAKTANSELMDLVAVYDFTNPNQPLFIKLPVGIGAELMATGDAFITKLITELPKLITDAKPVELAAKVKSWLDEALSKHQAYVVKHPLLEPYLNGIRTQVEILAKNIALTNNEFDAIVDSLMNDSCLVRFRVNLLVDNRDMQKHSLKQAVIYDQDPSFQSLFGYLEGSPDHTPEFLRLRAGNLHKADGGMILLQLRDLLSDEQNTPQLLEKLYRFLRNQSLQFEDHLGGVGGGHVVPHSQLPINVKLVLIALREDFYNLLEENPDFFDFFPIKVEFADTLNANTESYTAIANYIAHVCDSHNCLHFDANGVAELIVAQQRLEEDQARISTNFAHLEQLVLESVAHATGVDWVSSRHVKAALAARNKRHQYFETQIRESIADNELLIQVNGEVVGQVNGLTHVELGDASFGSPIRITARCYPGQKGLINIDREVNMSGPNHDKGIYILQNWLNASFSNLAPLSLNASLVFEQEYNGVEGDSASCAELFALLSALTNLPIRQGIAVTGALNQFGEVMPIGGVNEKIEGYFRVCKELGLDGHQGVIIPQRNQRHLLLDDEVIAAVKAGQFHIVAINHVLEGIAYLTGNSAGNQDDRGIYQSESVMGAAQQVLAAYRQTLVNNQAKQQSDVR